MKTALTAFALFLASLSAFAQMERISVSGNQFVKPDGSSVVFRGYNTSDPAKLEEQGKWRADYFDELQSWGAQIVRFPVHPSRWEALGKSKYLELLDHGIRLAEERSMYVIIDWHSIGNLLEEKFYKPSYNTSLDQTKEFWKIISKRYGENPTVAFYELFNEPTAQNGQLGDASWDDWKLLNEGLIDIIQNEGGLGICLVAGFNWAYDLTAAYEAPIARQNVAYVSHPYPQKRPKPWESQWTADWGKMKEKAPVILTEIGFSGAEEKGAHIPVISDESYGKAISEYCAANDISFVVWVFDAEWSPSLFTNWDYLPSRHGAFFKKELTH
mgnify:CR=1 FL=1